MLRTSLLGLAASLCAGVAALPYDAAQSPKLPIVDVGYEIHQASKFKGSNDTYLFSNIRYAQAPVGELRFRAPRAPKADRGSVKNDTKIIQCPQGVPNWQALAFGPIAKYTSGKVNFSLPAWEQDIANGQVPPIPWTANNYEDCLFLDVYTPRKALDTTQGNKKQKGAPVLVWIHGGGYVLGSKTGAPTPDQDPSGMLKYAQEANELGMVFVALNYRLGALGFLAGPEVARDGDLTVGLLDQHRALEWVRSNIHLFGGDRDRTTVMGESGGAGSIMFELTAYGRKKTTLFQQAIMQSPGFYPTFQQPEAAYSGFLKQLNASSLAQVRKASSEAIIKANYDNLLTPQSSSYYYTAVKDGKFVPDTPAHLLQKGAFDKSIKVLTGVNSFEGGFFFDPTVKTEEAFKKWLGITFAGMNASLIDETASKIYPPIYDGSQGYVDIGSRAMAVSGDAVFYCNAEATNRAYGSSSYAYEFSVTPGIHIQDLKYTFSDEEVPYPAARAALQRAIVSFVVGGEPMYYEGNGTHGKPFPRWDAAAQTVVNVTGNGAVIGKKLFNATRCDWWHNKVV